jgi:hypothetical protein
MRFVLLPFALAPAFLCPPHTLFSAERSDIAGVWRLDTGNAPLIDGKQIDSARLTIQYDHKNIDMSESMTFSNGDRTVERNWKVDSRYHPVLGGGSGQVLAKWDGLTLTADHEMSGGHEIYRLALSPDAQVLTETIRMRDGSSRVLIWKR